jgi:hypothetical protein
VRRPPAWYSVRTREGDRTEVAHYGIPAGLIYRDLIQVSDLSRG